jgi:indole-3-glycerol phosphate synthase
MTILDEIVAYKREFVAGAKKAVPLEKVREAALAAPAPRRFVTAIRGMRGPTGQRIPQTRMRVIAEIKRASPSKGVIREDFDPAEIASSYEAGGASALSVLTDEKYFQGSLDALKAARAASKLPILRKEFMIDPYQVYEARAAGADAILLIAGLIPWAQLAELRALARELRLDVLAEIHNAEELPPTLELRPDILGINNRDLRTREFKTDLSQTENLIGDVPADQTLISESGIRDRADVARLSEIGVDGILVGEHLMREPDPGAAINARLGLGRPRASLAR